MADVPGTGICAWYRHPYRQIHFIMVQVFFFWHGCNQSTQLTSIGLYRRIIRYHIKRRHFSSTLKPMFIGPRPNAEALQILESMFHLEVTGLWMVYFSHNACYRQIQDVDMLRWSLLSCQRRIPHDSTTQSWDFGTRTAGSNAKTHGFSSWRWTTCMDHLQGNALIASFAQPRILLPLISPGKDMKCILISWANYLRRRCLYQAKTPIIPLLLCQEAGHAHEVQPAHRTFSAYELPLVHGWKKFL